MNHYNNMNNMINNGLNGFFSTLILICISIFIGFIIRYFYKKSPQYQEDLKQEELHKKDIKENDNLETFINLLENKKTKEK